MGEREAEKCREGRRGKYKANCKRPFLGINGEAVTYMEHPVIIIFVLPQVLPPR